MYKMSLMDIELMAPHVEYTDRPLWDTTRILSLFITAPYMKQKKDIQDMFPLPWDKAPLDDRPDDIKQHIASMQEYAKLL